jgi:hypothetical protein
MENKKIWSEALTIYGEKVFGSSEKFNEWLKTYCPALQTKPEDCAEAEIKTVLVRIEQGVYS